MAGYRKDKTNILATIGCLPIVASSLFLITCIFNAKSTYNKIIGGDIKCLCLLFLSIICILVFYLLMFAFGKEKEFYEKGIKLEKEKEEFEKKNKEEKRKLQESITAKENDLIRREKIIEVFVESIDKEKYCSELIADFKTVMYEDASQWLRNKYYAAPSAAETVRLLRSETRGYIEELKAYKYKENERIAGIEKTAQEKVNKAYADRNMMRAVTNFAEERLKSKTPFKEVAELYADAMDIAYGKIAQELREKVRPAITRAETIERELRKKIREMSYNAKDLKYRWDFLMTIFPEMENYVYDDESLLSMAEYEGLVDFSEKRDRARDYLSDDEYNRLSDVEKYQLSLDRYKERHKPNAWVAGAEYEMYCSYLLKKYGFSVIENGINMRKSDMGRDIIAYKNETTYIIQCKRYSLINRDGTDRYIHENVICQLFGTTIEYRLSNPDNSLFSNFNKIIPVLYTTGRLSDTAKAFAKQLKVEVRYCDMKDYPMIKCNINNEGEKIYHLPFDQQYWQTKIEKPGECYAWTVKEAEEKKFRRAKRWSGNDDGNN